MKPNPRSTRWFDPDDFRSFGQRSRMAQMGYDRERVSGPAGHRHHQHLVGHQPVPRPFQDPRRGRQARRAAGGRLSRSSCRRSRLSEVEVKPTTMLYRNFLAMETEELIRSHPIDGAVLMGGCDKTTPGLLLGATSAGVPAIYVPAGPMLRGNWKGRVLGSGSDAHQILGRAPRRQHLRKRLGRRSRTASPAPTASA